ncbi:TetR/AcrR family transcriptional regulator [Gordonia zhaorongruii]|uniref:TetR/AcrR family transcriptional regulator n=1 Tax=Gordonia zhaorongruii TaxID=2597659 RepID=UPI00104711BE|nr:TetR/AcrR family transcriptional regulator [Gordonia zhaorongruii]
MTASPRDAMIAHAALLIARDGVAGTSIGDVLTAAGASRGSVYHHFPGGRAELMSEAVRFGAEILGERLAEASLAGPGEAVANLAAVWRRVLVESDFRTGCVVAEAGNARETDPAAAEVADESFLRWEDRLAARFRAGGIEGERSRALAVTVFAAIEGAVMLCRVHRSLDPLDRVVGELQLLTGDGAGQTHG